MAGYILRRLLLMVPTVFAILTITFIIIQFVPGGPIDQVRAMMEDRSPFGTGETADRARDERTSGLSPEDLARLEEVYHLDRPLYERYLRTFIWYSPPQPEEKITVDPETGEAVTEIVPPPPFYRAFFNRQNWDGMLLFRFGNSFYGNKNVLQLIADKLPVSISLGFWSFIITYPTCIMLGIRKAVKEGTSFDAATTVAILLGYSIPGFVLAVMLIVLFGPGDAAILHVFPLSGLSSSGIYGYEDWSVGWKILDYFHHLIGPVLCLSIGSFAVLTMLAKNSLLEEFRKQYVITARAKGLAENKILYRHILRNAMIPLITGFPGSFVAIFFTGSVLVERIFNLDGIGLLAYNSVMQRDYPVVMGNLFIMTLLGLFIRLITDICYVVVDPRITFENVQR